MKKQQHDVPLLKVTEYLLLFDFSILSEQVALVVTMVYRTLTERKNDENSKGINVKAKEISKEKYLSGKQVDIVSKYDD